MAHPSARGNLTRHQSWHVRQEATCPALQQRSCCGCTSLAAAGSPFGSAASAALRPLTTHFLLPSCISASWFMGPVWVISCLLISCPPATILRSTSPLTFFCSYLFIQTLNTNSCLPSHSWCCCTLYYLDNPLMPRQLTHATMHKVRTPPWFSCCLSCALSGSSLRPHRPGLNWIGLWHSDTRSKSRNRVVSAATDANHRAKYHRGPWMILQFPKRWAELRNSESWQPVFQNCAPFLCRPWSPQQGWTPGVELQACRQN